MFKKLELEGKWGRGSFLFALLPRLLPSSHCTILEGCGSFLGRAGKEAELVEEMTVILEFAKASQDLPVHLACLRILSVSVHP